MTEAITITQQQKRFALSAKIRELREARGWSQVNTAKKLKVARQTYLSLENGSVGPKWDLLQDVIALFGCDPIWLLDIQPNPCGQPCPLRQNPRMLRAMQVYTGDTFFSQG